MPSKFTTIAASVVMALIAIIAAIFPLPLLNINNRQSPQTFCYDSITGSIPEKANCFSISTSAGLFSDVFTLDAASAAKHRRPGHVLPGLWDGHGHLLPYGELLHSINLFGSKSLGEATERVRKYVEENPGEGGREEWVRGVGWDQAAFEGKMPTAVSF